MQVIPAIDIIDGKCVRLTQGDYKRSRIYSRDPVETALMFEAWGLKRLHIVDLDGARAKHIVNYPVLEKIASRTSLEIDFGGGIKSDTDLETAFKAGARMITAGSIAVTEPAKFLEWLQLYGHERIILGADHKSGEIAISGWQENSGLELLPFINDFYNKGIRKVICTDISLDGMLMGPSLDIYRRILEAQNQIELIASGGVGDPSHLAALAELNIPAVIVGKAIYEGKIGPEELEPYLS